MKSEIIRIPLSGWIIGKKKYNLSMNTYRNLHHQVSNKLKKKVTDHLFSYRPKKFNKIRLEYTLYFKDKRNRDLMNFVSVVDKFFLDYLVRVGSLTDDNYKYVTGYTINYGGISDYNKAEIRIIEVED